MPNATVWLVLFSSLLIAQGQDARIVWPESEPHNTHESDSQDTYSVYVDEDGMEVVEVYGSETRTSSHASADVITPQDTHRTYVDEDGMEVATVRISGAKVENDIMDAIQECLAKATDTGEGSLVDIGNRMFTTFVSLPRNKHGSLDPPAVRYLAHSYFLKEHGWRIRGLEPHQFHDRNRTEISLPIPDGNELPDMMADDIPGFVQTVVLGGLGEQADSRGSLRLSEVVSLVAILRNLILNKGLVVEVYGSEADKASYPPSHLITPQAIPPGITTSTEYHQWEKFAQFSRVSSKFFEGLDDEDEEEDEMEDLIGRLGKFNDRVENAQTSRTEEAINARFFAGLDDDEDEEEDGEQNIKLSASAIAEFLETGKLPDNLEDLLETKPQVDAEVDLDTPAAPKKEVVLKDPPAVITSYRDLIEIGHNETLANSIVLLSRFNFESNVLTRKDDEVENWVILFCHDWYSPCGRIRPAFQTMAHDMEKELNQDSMKTVIRFAEVDCSTDKPLCNAQKVETFPTLLHYQRGVMSSHWEGHYGGKKDVKEMTEWMEPRSKTILEQRSPHTQLSTKNEVKGLLGVTLDPSWLFSLATMLATLLGHVWLVRVRSHGTHKVSPKEESTKDSKQLGNRPSGLGSLLPEEWICSQSGRILIEV